VSRASRQIEVEVVGGPHDGRVFTFYEQAVPETLSLPHMAPRRVTWRERASSPLSEDVSARAALYRLKLVPNTQAFIPPNRLVFAYVG